MPGLVKCLLAALVLAAPAAHAADWLDKAWSDEAVNKAGAPAITLGASAVLLVLPAQTLAEAHAQGVSTPDAVRLFLGRYGQHCSASLDLDRPHPNLRVQLFLQKPVALEDADERHWLLQEELNAEIGMRPVEIEARRAMLAIAAEEEPHRVRRAHPLGMGFGQGLR